MKNEHIYKLSLQWDGRPNDHSIKNDRLYKVAIEGKQPFRGSADQVFFGDPSLYNPEDLLLASLSACHMMSYFYVCRKQGIKILDYQDEPVGLLKVNVDGSGQFEQVTLFPTVRLANKGDEDQARLLHEQAGKLCFIANSCRFTILYEPQFLG